VHDTKLITPKLNKQSKHHLGVSDGDVEMFGDRFMKLELLQIAIEEFKGVHDIDLVVSESPFYSHLRPSAHAALVETVYIFRQYCFKNKLPFKVVEPLLVKKIFTGKGMAKKEMMKDEFNIKILNKEIVILNENINIESEHIIDSIAVGYTYFKRS
jgi:Holliday junction resolvasome RuvABC endonuclease subunit